MRIVLGAAALSLLAGLCAAVANAAEPPEIYLARQIWTGGDKPLADGALLVRAGKVVKVVPRKQLSGDERARAHDLGNAVIIPGLVVAESTLAAEGRGGERALAAHLRAIDGFDFFGDYSRPLAGGVTTVQISPGGGRLAPGQGSVVKLAGDDVRGRTLRETESVRIVLSQEARTPPTVFIPRIGAVSVDKPLTPTRQQLARSLAGAVSGLRALLRVAQKQAVEKKPPKADVAPAVDEPADAVDPVVQTLARYQQSRGTFRIVATTAAEIRAALNLTAEFNCRLLLVNPRSVAPLETQFSRHANRLVGVVLDPGARPGTVQNPPIPAPGSRPPETPWQNARRLLDRGVRVAIRPASDSDLPELLFVGGLFQQGGLTPAEVLRALTLAPAEVLGVSDRVGSLAAGKDADFVVLSGAPFASRTQVLATYVNGKRRYDKRTKNQTTVLRGAQILTAAGKSIGDGDVVIRDGKIRALGPQASAPLTAQVRDCSGHFIVPGFVDLGTGLGPGAASASTVTLSTRLGDQLDPADPAIPLARQGGVTTVLLGGGGTSSPLVAFKLGPRPRVLKDPVALRFSVRGNLTSTLASLRRTLTSAQRYADSWTKYEKELADYQKKLKEYEAAKAKYDAAIKASAKKTSTTTTPTANKATDPKKQSTTTAKPVDTSAPKPAAGKPAAGKPAAGKPAATKPAAAKPATGTSASAKPTSASATPKAPTKPTAPKKPRTSSTYEPYRPLLAGKIPAFVEARSATEMRAAVKLFRKDFKLRTILLGADDAQRTRELWQDRELAAVVGPALVRTVDRQVVNTPQVLANHQIRFGFQSAARSGVRQLPLAVRYAVHKGLGPEDALAGLTRSAARLLKLDTQIGTLEVGKDADLVLLSGPPFELGTRVVAVMIDGVWVYEESKP